MSFFTSFLETTGHFEDEAKKLEQEIGEMQAGTAVYIEKLIRLSYSYAYVQLQRGVERADSAIAAAGQYDLQQLKAHALCAKAMNEVRMGFMHRGKTNAVAALELFDELNDEEGKCDALFHLGSIIDLSVGPAESIEFQKRAAASFLKCKDATGISLTCIQEVMLRCFQQQFREAIHLADALLSQASGPAKTHLRCFAYMNKNNALFMMQDMALMKVCMEAWQPEAKACGNFHDYTMTQCLLVDCYRLQHLDGSVMKLCIEAVASTERLGSIHGYATIALIMANICYEQLQYTDAISYYLKADENSLLIGDIFKHHYALNAVGAAQLKLGRIAEAKKIFEDVELQAECAGDRLNTLTAQRQLAEVYFHEGKFNEAFVRYKRLFETADTGFLLAQDYGKYAESLSGCDVQVMQANGILPEGKRTSQFDLLQKYLSFAKTQQNKKEITNAFKALADFYEAEKDWQQAFFFQQEYVRQYADLLSNQNDVSVMQLRMQYEAEKKEQEITLLKRENEQMLLQERLRISRDLHDDMGATLSSISVFSEAVKQRIKQERFDEADKLLGRISDDAREMAGNISDMIWMLSTHNDSLEKLLEHIHSYASHTLSAKEIRLVFHCDEVVKAMQFSIQQRNHIYLSAKEAINNIAKYSGCNSASVSITALSERQLRLLIEDNGIGFDPLVAKGNGLRNMQARASEMKAEMTVTSEPGSGTRIAFEIPIPKNEGSAGYGF